MAKKDKPKNKCLVKNRKAFHDFNLFDKYEAGLELVGTEVKSCRAGNISLVDSFVKIENGEAFLYNAHIATYEHGNRFNHEPRRRRRLLLHKNEILKLANQTRETGMTIIPLKFFPLRGRIKVEIAVAKGKKQYDKRESLKRAQDNLDAKRAMNR